MKRKFFIVANPASGTRRLEYILKELMDFMVAKKYKFEIHLTAKSHNAWQKVSQHFDESYTDLLIVGGDGTINEAVNGLKYDIPVSIIPNGTGNDFVKNIRIGETLEDYLQVADHGQIKEVDLGICNGRKFLNGVGIGFDGQIVADMQDRKTLIKGPAKYYYFVLRILASYRSRSFQMMVDKQQFENDLILCCVANGTTFGGGFKLAPEAKIDDGKLDICTIGPIGPLKRFMNISKLQSGSHGELEEVSFAQANEVKVEANDLLTAHIDGEPFGHPPFEFGLIHKALKLRVK